MSKKPAKGPLEKLRGDAEATVALQQAQRDLAEARDRYQELYDLAPVAYVTIDRTSRILEANLAAGQLLGRERAKLVGALLSTFLVPADTDSFHRFRTTVFTSTARQTCELELVVNGRRIPVHVDALAVAGPEPDACRCVLVDLSALRAAQDQARTQAARIQAMFDTAPNAIIGVDDAGRIEAFSGAAERIFGYAADAVRGQHIQLLVPQLGELAAGQRRHVIGRCKDGTERTLLLAVGEWRDHERVKRTLIMHDRTEQELADRRRRESDDRFRAIAETIDDVFYIRERDGRISYASPAYERLRGEPVAALHERRELVSEAIHTDDRERMKEHLQRALAGEAYDEEFRMLHVDGTMRWVRDRAFPIKNQAGRVDRIIGVLRDVTTERELELQLHAERSHN